MNRYVIYKTSISTENDKKIQTFVRLACPKEKKTNNKTIRSTCVYFHLIKRFKVTSFQKLVYMNTLPFTTMLVCMRVCARACVMCVCV